MSQQKIHHWLVGWSIEGGDRKCRSGKCGAMWLAVVENAGVG